MGSALPAILVDGLAVRPSPAASSKTDASASTAALEREFFAAIREGEAKKFLSYVPEGGVNIGPHRSNTLPRMM